MIRAEGRGGERLRSIPRPKGRESLLLCERRNAVRFDLPSVRPTIASRIHVPKSNETSRDEQGTLIFANCHLSFPSVSISAD